MKQPQILDDIKKEADEYLEKIQPGSLGTGKYKSDCVIRFCVQKISLLAEIMKDMMVELQERKGGK